MTKDEALRMALDVLQTNYGYSRKSIEALTAIQEALAQPVLKPCHSPYCECTEGKCTHPGCYDARHEPFELPEPTPEQLAALGWQSIECPFCGTSGARAFPKPDCDWEGIAADQAMTIALMKSEQHEQEPVGLDKDTLRDMAGVAFETAMAFGISTDSFERLARDVNRRIVAVLTQPKQEPFKPDWLSYRQGKLDGAAEALEETKRKEWVGLTGGDMDDITSTAMDKADAMLLTEAKLKELNHD